MRAFEPWHFLVLAAVVAVLFGSKRLPDAARGLGRSMRIFKAEVKEMKEEGRASAAPPVPTAPPASPSPRPAVEPLEGRVVDDDVRRAAASEHRHDR